MLRHYMREHWQEDHISVVPDLLNQPGAFVREVALHARMIAAHERRTEVTLDMLERSVQSLLKQLRSERDFLTQRRPISLMGAAARRQRATSDSD
ncbi:MAG: hypothetical protein IPK19_42305 [Chloroflexi bacterium]|nr:hypothetical protein [Chloroflexota bacterium]